MRGFSATDFTSDQIQSLTGILVAGGRIANADNPTEETFELLGGKEYLADTLDDAFEQAKKEATDLASAVGDGFLYIVRNIGVVILDAIELTIQGIRDSFKGREVAWVAGMTFILLIFATILVLRHELTTGPGGAGEYMAMNRPSPGDGILGP